MNRQLQELAKQAGVDFHYLRRVYGQNLGKTIEADSWAAIDKFARLIFDSVLHELDILRERYENTDPWQTETYYVKMENRAEAIEDAQDHIRWKFEL